MGNQEGSLVSQDRSRIEDKYFLQKVKLGQGSFGTVWRAVDRTNETVVAVKQLDKAAMPKRGVSRKDIEREVELMKAVRHDNVTQLFDYYEDNKSIYLALEYCDGGDFGDKVKERGLNLQESEAADWMQQICSAIYALHIKGIIHRDIKPDNFMVAGSTVKLSDFGLACFLQRGKLLNDKCGTPAFMAPEQVMLGSKSTSRGYSFPVDMWAAGVAMYMLMFGGRHPFITSSNQLDEQMLMKGRLDFRDGGNPAGGFFGGLMYGQSTPLRFSDNARNFCTRMVEPRAEVRINAQDALRDPWLASVQRRPNPPQQRASNGGYPQQAPQPQPDRSKVLKEQMQQEALEKDRKIRSLEKKVTGLKNELDQKSQFESRPVDGPLRNGLNCRYQSSSYGWLPGAVQSLSQSDGTFNLDIRQHADPRSIAPPDNPATENDVWPSGTWVYYESGTFRDLLPAKIIGYNANDTTYNLDLREHAAIDRIRARIGDGSEHSRAPEIAGMRTEKAQQGTDFDDQAPIKVQATAARGSSSQTRIPDGAKCMIEQHGHGPLVLAIIESSNQDGSYNVLVDPHNRRYKQSVRADHMRAPQNAADAWPVGTLVMYESSTMASWLPGHILAVNAANNGSCTYNLDVRDSAPPEKVRPR